MGINVKQEDAPITPPSQEKEKKAKKRKKERGGDEEAGDVFEKKIKVVNISDLDEDRPHKKHKKGKQDRGQDSGGQEVGEVVEEVRRKKKKDKSSAHREEAVAAEETETKRKKEKLKEQPTDSGREKSKAKFTLSLSTSASEPVLNATNKKKKGPKIIIAQSGEEASTATPAERKQRKNRNKKKKDGGDGAVHESKGMNKALRYVQAWKEDRSNWKFEKCRQIWLLHNAYDQERISEANFVVVVEYMASIRGAMRNKTLEEAQQRLDKAAQWQAKLEAGVPEDDILAELGPKVPGPEVERAEKIVASLTSPA